MIISHKETGKSGRFIKKVERDGRTYYRVKCDDMENSTYWAEHFCEVINEDDLGSEWLPISKIMALINDRRGNQKMLSYADVHYKVNSTIPVEMRRKQGKKVLVNIGALDIIQPKIEHDPKFVKYMEKYPIDFFKPGNRKLEIWET